jgi:hypothetical protein
MAISSPETEDISELSCFSCIYFDDDPSSIEIEFPYLRVFGSAYSSARGDAGICRKFDRFLDPIPAGCCPSFVLAESRAKNEERVRSR